MSEIKLGFLIRREEGMWVAQCIEHDIVAQASSLGELKERIGLTVAAEFVMSMEHGEAPLASLPPPPEDLHDEFAKGHRLESPFFTLPELPTSASAPLPTIRDDARVLA